MGARGREGGGPAGGDDPAPAPAGGPDERLTQEELAVVGSSRLFEPLLGRRSVRWGLIFGITGLTTALLVTGFWASSLDVSSTLVVYMQERLVPGGRAAMRIAWMDEAGGYVPVTRAEVLLARPSAGGGVRLFSGGVPLSHAASVVFPVPAWKERAARMGVRAEAGGRKKEASFDVRLDAGWGGAPYDTSQLAESLRAYPGDFVFTDGGAGTSVQLFPEGYVLGSSLHNIVYVRTTDGQGAPAPRAVRLGLAAGYVNGEIPARVETDGAGLASFMVYPTFGALSFSVRVETPPGAAAGTQGTVTLPAEPRGFKLRPAVPDPKAGEPFVVRLHSIDRFAPWFADVYQGGVLTGARSGWRRAYHTEIALTAPREGGMVTLQGYGAPAYVGRAIASVHVRVRREGETTWDAVRDAAAALAAQGIDREYTAALLARGEAAGDVDPQRLLAYLESRLDRGIYEPAVFFSSRDGDKRQVAGVQRRIKTIVAASLGFAGLLFALAGVFALALAARSRAAVVPEEAAAPPPAPADLEVIEDWRGRKVVVERIEPLETLGARQTLHHTGWGIRSGMGTRRFYVMVALLAGVITIFFGLLAAFVSAMRWTFAL